VSELLSDLRAGKITMRQLMHMAKISSQNDALQAPEVAAEVMRQLVGHIERLVAENVGKTDLAAAYNDLERRFENWRDGESERMRRFSEWSREVSDLKGHIWGAYAAAERVQWIDERLNRLIEELGRVLQMSLEDDYE